MTQTRDLLWNEWWRSRWIRKSHQRDIRWYNEKRIKIKLNGLSDDGFEKFGFKGSHHFDVAAFQWLFLWLNLTIAGFQVDLGYELTKIVEVFSWDQQVVTTHLLIPIDGFRINFKVLITDKRTNKCWQRLKEFSSPSDHCLPAVL